MYVIKPSSVAQAAKTKPELPAQLYKYLAVSMARKYRVLASTAGYGLQRSDAGVDSVDLEEIFGNPVFLSFYARYLRQERPEKLPWFQAYTEIEEYRVMPIGAEATARGNELYAKYVLPGGPDALAFLSRENQLITAELMATKPGADGEEVHLAPEVFDVTIEEIKEELRLHTYDKFVASSHFAGVHELKCREKELPTADHFYFLQQLGVGSFGEVYAVRKKDSQRRYAMKVMAKASQAQMSKRWAMYIRIECDVMASLFHPSLVNLNYCFQTPEAVFMVLDLVRAQRTTPPTPSPLLAARGGLYGARPGVNAHIPLPPSHLALYTTDFRPTRVLFPALFCRSKQKPSTPYSLTPHPTLVCPPLFAGRRRRPRGLPGQLRKWPAHPGHALLHGGRAGLGLRVHALPVGHPPRHEAAQRTHRRRRPPSDCRLRALAQAQARGSAV